jgi:hypothetical protein
VPSRTQTGRFAVCCRLTGLQAFGAAGAWLEMGLPQSDGQLAFGLNFMPDPPDLQAWFGIASMGGVSCGLLAFA